MYTILSLSCIKHYTTCYLSIWTALHFQVFTIANNDFTSLSVMVVLCTCSLLCSIFIECLTVYLRPEKQYF